MKELVQKIKQNKVKIGIVSGVMATIVGASALCGILIPSNSKQTQDNTYYYKPGEIRFDENGNLLIPKVIDEDNPSGIYEHKVPEIIDNVVPEEIKESKFYKGKLNELVSDNRKDIHNILGQEVLETKIVINDELINFSKYFIPELVLEKDKEVRVQDVIDQAYSISVEKAKTKTLSNQEIIDMLAINGINFDKLYNDAQVEAEKELNMRGGGGSKPSIPLPDINTSFNKNPKVWEAKEIAQQDVDIRYGFAIAYSVVLPTLTIASGVLAFFTCGISVVSMALDIAFCAMEITNSWVEYNETKQLLESILAIPKECADIVLDEFWKKVDKELSNFKWLKDKFYFQFEHTKKTLKINFKAINKSVSIISSAVKITMPILEELIHRLWK